MRQATAAVLIYAYPWLMLASLAAVAAALVAGGRAAAGGLARLATRRQWTGLGVLLAAGLALRLWALPLNHQNLTDELQHLDIARLLAERGVFGLSVVGGAGDFDVYHAPIWPAAFHTMLALLFKITGVSVPAAFAFNAWLGTAGILMIFLASSHIGRDGRAGLWSAGLAAFLPLPLRYSASCDISTHAFFWLAATLLGLSVLIRRRDGAALAGTLAAANVAAHCRPEGIVVAPLLLWLLRGRGLLPRLTPGVAAAGAALAALAAPAALVVLQNRFIAVPQWDQAPRGYLANLAANLPANLGYLADPLSWRGLTAALAALGAIGLSRQGEGWTRILGGLALALLACYSALSTGRFAVFRADRYALVLYAPLLILAGAGGLGLQQRLRSPWSAPALVLTLLILSVSDYKNLGETRSDELERHAFLMEAGPRLPPGPYVVTFAPAAVIVGLGRPAVSARYLLESQAAFAAALASQGRTPNLILFQDFWRSQHREAYAALVAQLRRRYDFSLLAARRIGSDEFAFHLLTPRGSVPKSW